jgi:hypothetical protein
LLKFICAPSEGAFVLIPSMVITPKRSRQINQK